jgi:hypothetical protein
MATIRPRVIASDTLEKYNVSLQDEYNYRTMLTTVGTNVFPGLLVGAFTGTSIGYLSGQLFDAMFNPKVINALMDSGETKLHPYIPAIISLARLGAQVGSKWYWEKPLRNKIMTWLIAALKEKGVEFDEELTKTIARVSAWVGCAAHVIKPPVYY